MTVAISDQYRPEDEPVVEPPLEWRPLHSLSPRDFKIVEETSPRSPVQYELVAGGGLRWLRRTYRTGRTWRTEESEALRAAVANEQWCQLVSGIAALTGTGRTDSPRG